MFTFVSLLLAWLVIPGKPYWRGRLSTVDLLILTSLDQLIFILKVFIGILKKQVTLMRRSNVQSHPFQLMFPGYSYNILLFKVVMDQYTSLGSTLQKLDHFSAMGTITVQQWSGQAYKKFESISSKKGFIGMALDYS